jgi:hypothetical protein
MKLLEQGNATMGVWLGKQILGQSDQVFANSEFSWSACLVIPRSVPINRDTRGSDDELLLDSGDVVDVS